MRCDASHRHLYGAGNVPSMLRPGTRPHPIGPRPPADPCRGSLLRRPRTVAVDAHNASCHHLHTRAIYRLEPRLPRHRLALRRSRGDRLLRRSARAESPTCHGIADITVGCTASLRDVSPRRHQQSLPQRGTPIPSSLPQPKQPASRGALGRIRHTSGNQNRQSVVSVGGWNP